jgi:hypothetical protein
MHLGRKHPIELTYGLAVCFRNRFMRVFEGAPSRKNVIVRLLILLVLVAFGLCRSAVDTRRDSFTLDEYYHVTAGISYVRLADYRLNPEHPPLVKLWTGAFFGPKSFFLPALRAFTDKADERQFTADTVYFKNNPDLVQSKARIAMLALNGLLILFFALTAWRVFGFGVAVFAEALLVIDPTVAAHIPVVMTDLPITLLGATAVLWSFAAFRSCKLRDIVPAGLALGLTLATKHSGLVVAEFVALLGTFILIRRWRKATSERAPRLLAIAAIFTLAWLLLWTFYGFRFAESMTGAEVFNRPIASKIQDLNSPLLRRVMFQTVDMHAAPRSYLWGLADTLRAGIEGRPYPIYFLNREYLRRVPLYYFPCQLLSKLPIGILLLGIVGVVLLASRRELATIREPILVISGFAAFFMAIIALGNSGYAGIRHALPVYPACFLLAGAVILEAVRGSSRFLQVAVCLATLAAVISSATSFRPWEYRNELFGGSANAYRFFSDDGVDVGQRTKELADYYHRRLEPLHELPYVSYSYYLENEFQRRGIQTLNQFWEDNAGQDKSDEISGTIILGANIVSAGEEVGLDVFRNIEPSQRYGNLLIFRGVFHLPKQRAWRLYLRGINAVYSPARDLQKAERLFEESLRWNAEFFPSAIELGNLKAGRGARDEAITAFELAKAHAPKGEMIGVQAAEQISLLRNRNPQDVPPMRDPILE